MFCIKCGQQLSDGTVFCPRCGTQLTNNAPNQVTPSQAMNNVPYQAVPPRMANKPSKAPVIIIAVVVIVALLVAGLRLLPTLTGTFERSLSGTWVASFADGEAECRLHFNDSGDQGAAMLVRFDQTGDCIGYFEVIYLGEVTFTKENEGSKIISGVITMKNISNKDKSEHDFELPFMTIQYDYNTRTKEVTLESTFLSNYFNDVADHLTFKHMDDDYSYYPKAGDHYYDWNLFY